MCIYEGCSKCSETNPEWGNSTTIILFYILKFNLSPENPVNYMFLAFVINCICYVFQPHPCCFVTVYLLTRHWLQRRLWETVDFRNRRTHPVPQTWGSFHKTILATIDRTVDFTAVSLNIYKHSTKQL